ncbi:amino acid ABC transporter permease [Actinoallomurus sp. NPDC050550]|uniref:amino acid ABC transporter permease n=1 Tax=Actinoallomurus sp. NPDC050550 TaxID=3154937 RepID=UPI0033D791C9
MSTDVRFDHDRVDLADLISIADHEPVRRRPVGQAVGGGVILVLAGFAVAILVTNHSFDWPTVGDYLFDVGVLKGIAVTLELTIIAMFVGIVCGVVLAVLRLSGSPIPRSAAALYIWFFRGTPVLVQVLFWGFAASLFPRVGLGIPGVGFLVSWDTNTVIPIFAAAVLGLGLNEAAYVAEIVRGGLLSVPSGQSEAADALGLGRFATLRFVVLPQAMRAIIPPIGNQFISMLKMTSVVLVIGVGDLLESVTQIYSRNYRQIPLLIVASIWYLVMTTLLTLVQARLEKRFGRSLTRVGGAR